MSYIKGLHHVAIICSNYEVSKKFYTEALGLKVKAEHYRSERDSWKLDLAINEHYVIELFSFPSPPARVSRPEASGLRHLAFAVENLDECIAHIKRHHVLTEPVRIDEFTGKRFTFFEDPDHLPLELYEL
jgi:glyoxylase I family protein